MDKYINIEWPYENVVLRFPKLPKPCLTKSQWAALEAAERNLLVRGMISFTDVNTIDDSEHLVWMWQHCETYVEQDHENQDIGDWSNFTESHREALIARRVARVLAVMTFGPEFLVR